MGIFNTKQPSSDAAVGTADSTVQSPADTADPTALSSPAAGMPADTVASDGFAAQTAPPLEDASATSPNEDNGGYIVTDLPANQQPADMSAQNDEATSVEAAAPPVIPDPINVSEAQANAGTALSSTSIPVADTNDSFSSENSQVSSDLDDIKQQAIKQLSPLVSKLDQSPEEKFHTAMMMLQATDDRNLVSTAYQAAQEITDEKAKAQALLDIVNEINYLDQKNADK